jgi:hypothetical protein
VVAAIVGAAGAIALVTGVLLLSPTPIRRRVTRRPRALLGGPDTLGIALASLGGVCVVLWALVSFVRVDIGDYGDEVFRVLLWNDTGGQVTVYLCDSSECPNGHLIDRQMVDVGSNVVAGTSAGGGGERYVIVDAKTSRRTCIELRFHSRFDNIRIPMSDATPC